MDYAASILARIPGISARRDYGLQQLMKKLQTYMTEEQLAVVAKAYEFGAEAHAGHSLDSEVATFAAVRAWKDGFR